MRKVLIAVALLSLTLAIPVMAENGGQPANASRQTFEQRQTRILKMIDQRIEHLQEGKACVQAAKSDDDLRECREKQRSEMRGRHGAVRNRRGTAGDMSGPGDGMGGPMGQ